MSAPAIVEALNQVGAEANDRVSYLNYGGCCVYAYHVARNLERVGVPARGRVATHSSLSVDEMRDRYGPRLRTLDDWNCYDFWFTHVLVQFKLGGTLWTHDSTKTVPGPTPKYDWKFHARIVAGRLDVPELRRLALSDGWNPAFCRETGVPVVRRVVGRGLRRFSITEGCWS